MFLKTVVRHSSTTITARPEIMEASGERAPHELFTADLHAPQTSLGVQDNHQRRQDR
jgi:hypothetical protein